MLMIDMLEEPADEDDVIFRAHNEFIGDRYILVTNDAMKSIHDASDSFLKAFSRFQNNVKKAISDAMGVKI